MYDRNYILSGMHEFYGLILEHNDFAATSIASASSASSSESSMSMIEVIDRLETIFDNYGNLKIRSVQRPIISSYTVDKKLYLGPPDRVAIAGEKMAELICNGTVRLVRGIRYGTRRLSSGIESSGSTLKSRIEPSDDPISVPTGVQSKLDKAKLVGTGVAKVSGALLTGALATKDAISQVLVNIHLSCVLSKFCCFRFVGIECVTEWLVIGTLFGELDWSKNQSREEIGRVGGSICSDGGG